MKNQAARNGSCQARDVDEAAVRIVRRRSAVDLAIGEALALLDEDGRLLQLGYAKHVDYARERLGLPARSMFQSLRLARGVADKPLLRRALIAGAVTQRKALVVLPVAVGADEAVWTAAAMASTVAWLEKAVKAHGAEPLPEGLFEMEVLRLRMPAAAQDGLDAALALAREQLGPAAPRWQCLEAICQEWLGAHGVWSDDAGAGAGAGEEAESAASAEPPGVDWRAALRRQASLVERQLRAVEEAAAVSSAPPDRPDALTLDARLQRLLAARRNFDLAFGPLAARIVADRIWAALGFGSLEEYCRERLGLSARSVQERAWLERRMRALPALREALRRRVLSYSKALLVARDATPFDVDRRIADAARTTWQQTERASARREHARNRAAGVRRLWGPADAIATVREAIASAQAFAEAEHGIELDDGAALWLIGDHFVRQWRAHRGKKPRRSRDRERVLTRHEGLCAVPGCSRAAEHEHHIEFRARGGCDETWNRVGLCAAHHLYSIHRGFLTVAGRAGERLVWQFGTGEAWITEGDNEVRRPRAAASPPWGWRDAMRDARAAAGQC